MGHALRRRKKVAFDHFDAARDVSVLFTVARLVRAGHLDWFGRHERRSLLRMTKNRPAHDVLKAMLSGKTSKLRGRAQKLYSHIAALARLAERTAK